jgi:hypothetical protein
MPITKLKLSWPRDVPTDEEIEAMMALREDVGEDRVLRSPKGTCDGYQTAIWNTTEGMVDMESSVTLPVHYKSHWDQLIYSIMYCYHVYSWLKSWKERTNSDNSLLAASMEIHAKYLRYLADVKTKIKSDAVNLSTVESDARIPVFDDGRLPGQIWRAEGFYILNRVFCKVKPDVFLQLLRPDSAALSTCVRQ